MSDAILATIPSRETLQAELDSVLGAQLSPEVIRTYVDTAMGGVVSVVEKATEAYMQSSNDIPETSRELEDAALEHFRLRSVTDILGTLSIKSDEIKRISAFVDNLETSAEVITPTDPGSEDLRFTGHEDPFHKKEKIPRLETLLFILQSDFGIDVFNEDEAIIMRGSADSGSMRKQGYDFIEIPGIDRVVLSCDEEDNVTFVFAISALTNGEIAMEELCEMTKPQLNQLLNSMPGAGQRVIYSKNYTLNISRSLRELRTTDGKSATTSDESLGGYLIPVAPAEVESMSAIVMALRGVGFDAFNKALEQLSSSLGEVKMYTFGTKTALGYNEQQRWQILAELDRMGVLAPPVAPDGVESISSITESLGLHYDTLEKAILELGDELGEVETYAFGPRTALGYNEQQRWQILAELDRRGIFAPDAPAGVESASAIARELKISNKTLSKAIEEIEGQLGEVETYRSKRKPVPGYNEQQRWQILAELDRMGVFLPEAPEGTESARMIYKGLGCSQAAVANAISALRDKLGEVKTYKFGNNPGQGYNEQQRWQILAELDRRGIFAPDAPAGVESESKLRHLLHANTLAIEKAISELGDKLGEVKTYKFGESHKPGRGYTKQQQNMLLSHMGKQGTD